MATYTLDWSETNLGGSAVVSYGAGAVLDFTDKPGGATAALSLAANQGGGANVTMAEFSIETSGSSVMTFDYHVSSESGYDKLHIDVDGVSQADYSGTVAWTSHAGISIPSAGVHTIRFRYQKDGGGDIDADRAWVALLNITNTVTVNDASGSVTTYDMEDGAIPSAVTTATWTNSTSAPIAGTRSLRSPASTAGSGSYDLDVTQGASSGYTVVAFDWKVSSEQNYDELYIFPDSSAGNVPGSGAPSSAGSPGWLEFSGTASGRLGIIVPAAGRTLRLRYAKDAGGDAGSDAAWIDGLALPTASGTNYTKTPADAAGITDSAAKTLATARTPADPLGLTDARTVVRTSARTQADGVGATDARTVVQTSTRTAADPVGLTDSVSVDFTGDIARTPADSVGLTDSIAVVFAVLRTVADSIGVTDTDSPLQLEIEEALADGLGITDAASGVVARSVTIADAVGITDAANHDSSGDATATPSDPVGATDAASRALAAVRAASDPLGVTDTAAAVQALVVLVSDALGIADAASAAGEGVLTASPADPVGLADTTSTGLERPRAADDAAGIADGVGAVIDRPRPVTDGAGLTDSVVAVMERVVTVTDPVGCLDLASSFRGLLETPAARTLVVSAESRTLVVPAENRTMEA